MENRYLLTVKGFQKKLALLAVFGTVVLVLSCQDRTTAPENLLPKDKMVAVLMDVYIAEQKVGRLGLAPDSATQVFVLMEKKIFETHEVSDSAFRQTLKYYTDHSEELGNIYGGVIDSLVLREQRATPPGVKTNDPAANL